MSRQVTVVLQAFGGLLRSEPQVWNDPPREIRAPVRQSAIKSFNPFTPTLEAHRVVAYEEAVFTHMGYNLTVDGIDCAVYELTNAFGLNK